MAHAERFQPPFRPFFSGGSDSQGFAAETCRSNRNSEVSHSLYFDVKLALLNMFHFDSVGIRAEILAVLFFPSVNHFSILMAAID